VNTLAIARVCGCKVAVIAVPAARITSCNHFPRQRQVSITAAARKAIVDVDIAVLQPSKLFERPAKCQQALPS
jgi:hypothetical protein